MSHGQRLGYIRVSSLDQNTDRQLEGVKVDKIFTDKVSGKDVNRPQLQALLEFAREGDTVVVHSLDRLARNLDDLRQLVTGLTRRGVRVEFVKEGLTFTGEDSAMSKLLLSVMGAFAEFERQLLKERQREGIEAAKRKGVYKGRKKALTPAQVEQLRGRVQAGEKKAALARELGISRETLYQALRDPTGATFELPQHRRGTPYPQEEPALHPLVSSDCTSPDAVSVTGTSALSKGSP